MRIWKDGMLGGGVNAVINKKKKRCGRKRIEIDTVAMEQIPPQERTTLESLSKAMRMSVSTLHRCLKEKKFRRHSNALKPTLTEENKKTRVRYCLSMLKPSIASLHEKQLFKSAYNIVHIDEKWFYRTRESQWFYLTNEEPDPERHCKNKGWIQKVMFLAAVARPRFDSNGNCIFDGKIGV